MARPVKSRTTYAVELATVQRIARIVSADRTRPADWRRRVVQRLHEVAQDLQEDLERSIDAR